VVVFVFLVIEKPQARPGVGTTVFLETFSQPTFMMSLVRNIRIFELDNNVTVWGVGMLFSTVTVVFSGARTLETNNPNASRHTQHVLVFFCLQTL
jgi:hypothetical protein